MRKRTQKTFASEMLHDGLSVFLRYDSAMRSGKTMSILTTIMDGGAASEPHSEHIRTLPGTVLTAIMHGCIEYL
jgi:hypothetical protein